MKYAIVTGGTSGIGLGVAKMLLRKGYYVFSTYVGPDFVESIENYEAHKIDQTRRSEIYQFLAYVKTKCPSIDCIICNAGMTLRTSLQDIVEEDWERVMQMNVNSNVYLIRDLFDCIPHGSRIVFTGSLMGILPHSVSLSYGVTKAAVLALAKNLVKFFEGTNTTVNAIAPGFVETEWQKNKPQEIRNNIYNKTAIKRFADPREIADAVRFCINNAFVNGSIIEVSGGYCYK